MHKMNTIIWYIKYVWVKLNIWVLTPLVWLENQYKEYEKLRIEMMCK